MTEQKSTSDQQKAAEAAEAEEKAKEEVPPPDEPEEPEEKTVAPVTLSVVLTPRDLEALTKVSGANAHEGVAEWVTVQLREMAQDFRDRDALRSLEKLVKNKAVSREDVQALIDKGLAAKK